MKNKLQSTQPVAAFRRRAGITQEQLAVLLGCSISKIKMVETGRRLLNQDELKKLAALEIEYPKKRTVLKKDIPAVAIQLYNSMESSHAADERYQDLRCRHLLRKYTRQLAKMEAACNTILALLHSIEKLEQSGLDQHDPRIRAFIIQRPKLLLKLRKCNPHEQEKLRNKIALLRAEAMTNKSLHRGM